MTKQQKYIVGGAVAALALYLVFGKKSETGNGVDPTGNDGAPGSGIVFDAAKVSEDLYRAMKEMGTDEEAIIQTLVPVSPAQFVQVVKVFGKKGYNVNTGTNWGIWLEDYTLPEWLREELSTSDYNKLKIKYPNSL